MFIDIFCTSVVSLYIRFKYLENIFFIDGAYHKVCENMAKTSLFDASYYH